MNTQEFLDQYAAPETIPSIPSGITRQQVYLQRMMKFLQKGVDNPVLRL
jgi:hypothetical protein